jgi:hypothetical protein
LTILTDDGLELVLLVFALLVFIVVGSIVFGILAVIFCGGVFLFECDFAVLTDYHLELLVLVVLLADQILVITSLCIVFGFRLSVLSLIHYLSVISHYFLNLLLIEFFIVLLFIAIITLLPIISIAPIIPFAIFS